VKYKFWEWADRVAIFLLFAVPIGLMVANDVINAQTPVPARDYTYACTSPTGPAFTFHFLQFPFQSIIAGLIPPASPANSIAPVISSVIYSGGKDVLPGTVKIPASTNGVPLTITATDDIGVMYYQLEIDGRAGPRDGNGVDVLPTPFYVRWNATPALGPHTFRLTVWDGSFNPAEKIWTMIR
jgi:hypothetical protein